MSNMSYCRFRNTLSDLRDCADHLEDELSMDEHQARKHLIELAREIAGTVNEGEENDLPIQLL